jgi:hypothetical protein
LPARINSLCCENFIQFTSIVKSCFANSVTRLLCHDKKQILVTGALLHIRHSLLLPVDVTP